MNLVQAIRVKYKAPAWVVFEEVANETGFNANRRADALAFGVWPSHGHALHGFEIKSSRSDWLRELRDPTKADTFLRYCDRFWLVAEPKVAVESEIPASWGWLERTSRGLRVRRDAPKLTPEPVPRSLWASMLRSVDKTMVSKATMEAEIERRHDVLKTSFEKRSGQASSFTDHDAKELERRREAIEKELERHREAIERFNRVTGLNFNIYYPTAAIDTIQRVERLADTIKCLRNVRGEVARAGNDIAAVVQAMDHMLAGVDPVVKT